MLKLSPHSGTAATTPGLGLILGLLLLALLSGCANQPLIAESFSGPAQQITWTKGRGLNDWATDLALSSSGEVLAVGSRAEHIRLFDTKTRKRINVLTDHAGAIHALDFSPDGNYLVSGGDDLIVKVWDANKAVVVHRLSGHSEPISDIAFSPDGHLIASSSHDQTLRLWDAKTGKQVRVFNWDESELVDGDKKSVYGLSFSADGSHIAAAGVNGVRLWQVASGQLVVHHVGSRSTDITFSSDQRFYATNGGKKSVKEKHAGIVASVWSNLDHRLVAEFKYVAHKRSNVVGRPSHIRFTPDNRKLLLAGSGTVYWNFQSKSENDFHGFERFPFVDLDKVTPPFFIYGGKIFIPPVRFPAGVGDIGAQPIYTPDGKTLITRARGDEWSPLQDPLVHFWSVATGQRIRADKKQSLTVSPPYRKRIVGTGTIAVSTDGKWLANSAGVWDLATFTLLPFSNNRSWPKAVTFSQDSQYLAVAFRTPAVEIWDMATRQERLRIRLTDERDAQSELYAKALQLDRENKNLIVVSNTNAIYMYDVKSGEQKWFNALDPRLERIQSIAISPDNKKLLVGKLTDQKVTIDTHDLHTGKRLSSKPLQLAHTGYVRGNTRIRFSSDGLLAAVSYPLHQIRTKNLSPDFIKFEHKVVEGAFYNGPAVIDIFSVTTGELIRRIQAPRFRDRAVPTAFLEENSMIAVGSINTRLWLFDSRSGKLLRQLKFRLPRELGSIEALQYSPVRNWLIATSSGGSRTTRILDVDTGDEVTMPATPGEWVEGDNRDSSGKSPLHYAVLQKSTKEVKRFLALGADVNARDGSLMTPLHMAAQYSTLEIVKILIGNGAQSNAKNNYGWTPLYFAKKRGYIAMIEYFSSIGVTK